MSAEGVLTLLVRASGLPKPFREYRFAPPRRWRFDLAWPERLVACEIDGGGYVAGRHSRGKGIENDCEKLSEAAVAGWRVLRVTPAQVQDGRALDWLKRILV